MLDVWQTVDLELMSHCLIQIYTVFSGLPSKYLWVIEHFHTGSVHAYLSIGQEDGILESLVLFEEV